MHKVPSPILLPLILFQIFGPLLLKYFTYEELRDLKKKVVERHLEQKEKQIAAEVAAEELGKWALDQVTRETSSSKLVTLKVGE